MKSLNLFYLNLKFTFRVFFIYAFIFNCPLISGQSFNWEASITGPRTQVSADLAIDASGNIYVIGTFEDITDFDPGQGTFTLTNVPVAEGDAYICKYNSSGGLVWVRQIAGPGAQLGAGIALDPLGNVYATGSFDATTDFDPGPGTFTMSAGTWGTANTFVLKLDGFGNFMWAKKFGGNDNMAYKITLDAFNNICCTGWFSGTVDFDPGPGVLNMISTLGTRSIFISKLDGAGNSLWAKSICPSQWSEGFSIATDASGNVYTSGFYGGSGDFDPGPGSTILTSSLTWDCFILKLDPAGNFNWATGFGSTDFDFCYGITIDNSSNVIATGTYSGMVDFDPGSTTFTLASVGNIDIFVCKLTSNGNFLWAKSIGGLAPDIARSVTTDSKGNIYTTGWFQNVCDFDPGPLTYTLNGIGPSCYLNKLNPSGDFVWALQWENLSPASSIAQAVSLKLDPLNRIVTTGNFNSTLDFDPSVGIFTLSAPNGSLDAFVVSLDSCSIPLAPLNSIIPSSSICAGNAATLTAVSNGNVSWHLTTPMPTIGTGTFYVTNTLSPGTYTYFSSAKNTCGQGFLSSPVTLTVLSLPLPTLSISGNFNICSGETVTLAASGANSYDWVGQSIGPVIVVSPSTSSIYTVIGMSSFPDLCIAEQSVMVNVQSCAGLNELVNTNSISIYPIPADEFLIIESIFGKFTFDLTWEITDVTGRNLPVHFMYLEDGILKLDAKDFSTGVYYLKSNSTDHLQKSMKFIVHHR